MNIPLAKPEIGGGEIARVTEVLRSGHLSLGPRVPEFEDKFAVLAGMRYAVAVNSGTSALHLCVRALGIGAGDEVITTSFSFVASTNCILYERAVPVFVDIDPATLNIDPAQIEKFLTLKCEKRGGETFDRETGRRVKAILPVHVFGRPCDMDEIGRLAREYGLLVIEDACEALGATFGGRHVGTFGEAATFAFYPNKQITTGEGGMVVTNDEQVAEACKAMRNQGRDPGSEWLNHARLGFNYRLSDVHAALGIAQLERFEQIQRKRAAAAQWYTKGLRSLAGIRLPADDDQCRRSWFVFAIQLQEDLPAGSRGRVMKALRRAGVSCQSYFPAIHQQPYLEASQREIPFALPATESAAERGIALPFFSGLREDEAAYVCGVLRQALQAETSSISVAEEQAAL